MTELRRIWTRSPLLALFAIALAAGGSGCGGGRTSSSLPPPSPDDYFYNILVNGNVVRWTQMPVRVYMNQTDLPPNWRPEYLTCVEEAMQEWSAASEGKLILTSIASQTDPCVTIKWVTDHPLGQDPPTIGVAKLILTTISGRQYIKQVQIELATTSNGRPLSDIMMKRISLHELGHAIGLWGHSDNSEDIMCESVSVDILSDRDKATLIKLYSTPPNIFEMPITRAPKAAEETTIIIMP